MSQESRTNEDDRYNEEHYLDDRYPYDPDKDCRVDVYDGEDATGFIDFYHYEKCRYGCYRRFYNTFDSHQCSICYVLSCNSCAVGFKKCKECKAWICGKHKGTKKCSDCTQPSTSKK